MAAPIFMPQNHKSLFRQLLAGLYDAVLITDPNGHLLEINPRGVEYFQYQADEVADRPIGLFIPGVTAPMVQRIRKGLDDARHIMLDASCQRKDGTAFAAEVTISVIDLMNPGDLVFTVRNIERRRRQLETFRSEENAFNVSEAALFVCAPDGRFRRVNRSFLDMFGYADDAEAARHTFSELMPDDPLPTLFSQAMNGERSATRIKAEEDGAKSEEIEIQLEPDLHGKKIAGVVGSIIRV